ncbi:MAG TPA: class I mannose-6-phosphate isomerase [Verrucomicrobiae bacterium]|nr:class I mannose-6-phosphate isomerase [Verrucomicrobiae bacterium]
MSREFLSGLPLGPNPVWRSYRGGSVLRAFRGQPGTGDDHFPEDWLASTVLARNGENSQGVREGLSRISSADNGLLIELLKQKPGFWFGAGQRARQDSAAFGVLWKLLDSSVRLQFQAHPDARFARRHLNSPAGKTECWYILGTRGEAHVYLGFQHSPSREAWARMIREQRVDEMLACFEKIRVQPGDCYVVPAGTPHAIGAGVFMMELMEPTDWVVRCETTNAGLTLAPDACFMGLDLETCMEVFDYRPYSLAEVRRIFQQSPRELVRTSAYCEEELIGPAYHEYFRLHRLRGHGDASWQGGELLLLIIIKGEADLVCGRQRQPVRAGQTLLLPGAGQSWNWTQPAGDWEILLAKLPVARSSSRHS